jgi:hypothetical protein
MPNPTRLRIDRQFRLYDEFADEILVKCPNCENCARARKPNWDGKKRSYIISMGCLHCAMQQELATAWDFWNELPLWLQTTCCGERLWALNSRHVMALQDYVSAGLRENKLGHHTTRHMFMSLPRWLTSKKNRPDVLRGLKRLQAKLAREN